jgi:RHS repeat-associated protein
VIDAFANTAAFETQAATLYREVLWLTGDYLGTLRLIAERAGKTAGIKRRDYAPFGEELLTGVGHRSAADGYVQAGARIHYTSYERDAETGLDYVQARYFASSQGRFTAVDPLPASANPANLPSFNPYGYTINNLQNTDGLVRCANLTLRVTLASCYTCSFVLPIRLRTRNDKRKATSKRHRKSGESVGYRLTTTCHLLLTTYYYL